MACTQEHLATKTMARTQEPPATKTIEFKLETNEGNDHKYNEWDFVELATYEMKGHERGKQTEESKKEPVGPLLPPQSTQHKGRATLVLDMDETLVYTRRDMDLKLKLARDKALDLPLLHIAKRPGVDTFLEKMAKRFEVVVFTCAKREYANLVLDKLDPSGSLIAHRLFRNSCRFIKGQGLVKDLSLLGRDLRRVVILDDRHKSFLLNPMNGLLIRKFKNKRKHKYRELMKLTHYLSRLAKVEDVTKIIGATTPQPPFPQPRVEKGAQDFNPYQIHLKLKVVGWNGKAQEEQLNNV